MDYCVSQSKWQEVYSVLQNECNIIESAQPYGNHTSADQCNRICGLNLVSDALGNKSWHVLEPTQLVGEYLVCFLKTPTCIDLSAFKVTCDLGLAMM